MGSQEECEDPILHVKFFTPDGGWSWYVAEGEALPDGDYLFYGYVIGVEPEWGNFTLSELQSVRGKFNLPVERELWFEPTPFSVIEKRKY